jgi:hypothetical protein
MADLDLGGGGVTLLPTQSGGAQLATAGGKDGRLFLLDQNNLGTALDVQQLSSGCWCGETYYGSPDGTGRVVSLTSNLQVWEVVTGPAPHLVAGASSSAIPASVQDSGGFTVVSSNGRRSGTAIIWAVGRPTADTGLTLYAFSATPPSGTLPLLYSSPAGAWPNLGGNANTVPVVANGKVYVAAYKTVTIFGRGGTAAPPTLVTAGAVALPVGTQRATGTLVLLDGSQMTLSIRGGGSMQIDARAARAAERAAELVVGHAYTVFGPVHDAATPWVATAITRAKPGQGTWPADQ